VTDVGGLNDHSYNEYAWTGVQAGAAAIGARAVAIVPRKPADYARSIQKLVSRRAAVVVTVGFRLADATFAAALANPTVQFIGVDQYVTDGPPNYQGLVFDHAQSGYLAGIVAGTMSGSGKIGAIGGMRSIPAVLAYINGYRNGARSVDPGVVIDTAYTEDFASPELGYAAASAMIDAGADVVFGVAGGTNAGILAATCDGGVWGIGVDIDQYLQLPDLQACILTSAENRITTATSDAIERWFAGLPDLQGGVYFEDASNLGIGIAPIRNTPMPDGLQAALDAAYAGLAAGTINPCLPSSCDTP
jgi:basic membrane protein A